MFQQCDFSIQLEKYTYLANHTSLLSLRFCQPENVGLEKVVESDSHDGEDEEVANAEPQEKRRP